MGPERLLSFSFPGFPFLPVSGRQGADEPRGDTGQWVCNVSHRRALERAEELTIFKNKEKVYFLTLFPRPVRRGAG